MKYNFLVDSHCHLDLLEEKGLSASDLIKEAKENNVKFIQTICTKISQFEKIYKFAAEYENVFASIGTHPCNIKEENKFDAEDIINICNKYDKVIGIGETGLDYYHLDFDKNLQIESFLKHIDAARQTKLPLIIHSRNADDDMIKILYKEMKKGEFKALLHCFSSSKDLAVKAISMGIYISLSGILTFKNATSLQDIIKELPIEFLLVETDAPYLAPDPYRGKVNRPAFTKYTAQFLANLKQISYSQICQATSENFFTLFDKKNLQLTLNI